MASRVIHKYRNEVPGGITLSLPEGSLILKVADQENAGGALDVWAEVDSSELGDQPPLVERRMKVVPTGVRFDVEALRGFGHFDTVVTAGGSLVWHVYLDRDGERRVTKEVV